MILFIYLFLITKMQTVTHILFYPTRGPMTRAENIIPSFSSDTTYTCGVFGLSSSPHTHPVCVALCLNTLELFSFYYPFPNRHQKSVKSLLLNSLIQASGLAWKILYPISLWPILWPLHATIFFFLYLNYKHYYRKDC